MFFPVQSQQWDCDHAFFLLCVVDFGHVNECPSYSEERDSVGKQRLSLLLEELGEWSLVEIVV